MSIESSLKQMAEAQTLIAAALTDLARAGGVTHTVTSAATSAPALVAAPKAPAAGPKTPAPVAAPTPPVAPVAAKVPAAPVATTATTTAPAAATEADLNTVLMTEHARLCAGQTDQASSDAAKAKIVATMAPYGVNVQAVAVEQYPNLIAAVKALV